jgi:hypothetical protein
MRIFSKRIVAAFIIAALPYCATSQTTAWLDSVAVQPASKADMGYELADIQGKIYEIKQDSSRAYLDSVNLAGKPKYDALCATNTKNYLADLAQLNHVCAGWLTTNTISSLPTFLYATYYFEQKDSTAISVYFAHLSNGYYETRNGYAWNDDTLCLPESFDFMAYKNIQKCIDAGLIIPVYNADGDGIPDASDVEPIAFNTVSKTEQAEKLLFQINQILKLAQHQPKLKGLPSPAEYATWEKTKNFATLDEMIKTRTNVLLKLSEKL